jgi:hypothetical protein
MRKLLNGLRFWKRRDIFRDVGVAGSNPVTPTIDFPGFFPLRGTEKTVVSRPFPSCVTGCVTDLADISPVLART